MSLGRLSELHAVAAAGDAAFAVALASTVLALPVGQARGQVAVFLLTAMAPFVLLAPLVGPVLDRFGHGRRWAIGSTLAVRAFLSWVLAGLVVDGSAWVLPVALVCLLAARAYVVARAAAIPLVRPDGISLVTANSRQSIAALAGMVIGVALAGPLGHIGAEWSLRLAFALYVVATVQAIRLPARVDSPPPPAPALGPTGRPSAGAAAGRPRAGRRALGPLSRLIFAADRRHPLSTHVRSALIACTGSRVLAGFVTLFDLPPARAADRRAVPAAGPRPCRRSRRGGQRRREPAR